MTRHETYPAESLLGVNVERIDGDKFVSGRVAYSADWGYDGQFEENMVVCVESYIGADGGPQGIKLEQQVRITRTGADVMSKAPIVDALEI